jgi:hypothetical protein
MIAMAVLPVYYCYEAENRALRGPDILAKPRFGDIPSPATIIEICSGGSLWELYFVLYSKRFVKDVHSSR